MSQGEILKVSSFRIQNIVYIQGSIWKDLGIAQVLLLDCHLLPSQVWGIFSNWLAKTHFADIA